MHIYGTLVIELFSEAESRSCGPWYFFLFLVHKLASMYFELAWMFWCFLVKDKRLCVPKSSIREVLVKEAHEGGLMGHFGVQKTYDILHEHFYWPHMKSDVHSLCDKCLVCKKAKSKVKPHGLYTLLPIL